jgi:phosphoribosylanthranilate isomerase
VRSRVKICGITTDDDARAAIESGADLLGMIFANSARMVAKDQASRIGARAKATRKVRLVGVFKDASPSEVADAISKYSLDLVQCHGNETRDYCWELHFPLIKAIELAPAEDNARESLLRKIDEYGPVSKYLLFDRAKGRAFDAEWLNGAMSLLEEVHVPVPYFFAGGLTADNVKTVLSRLSPFGVDVASGIEQSVGKKDHAKMRQFVRAVHYQGGIAKRRHD